MASTTLYHPLAIRPGAPGLGLPLRPCGVVRRGTPARKSPARLPKHTMTLAWRRPIDNKCCQHGSRLTAHGSSSRLAACNDAAMHPCNPAPQRPLHSPGTPTPNLPQIAGRPPKGTAHSGRNAIAVWSSRARFTTSSAKLDKQACLLPS
ncbi:hypothetical protein BS50DRAFT_582635 [Corynespora cassiicola Philippines]|uniref:Uncharacterized protein n=1 Tax=Corynespora cassiicola Philippines TaxID=1448308 RepID=A0A2T2P5T0_CORCC|nr:hypothetical protein BS50DRAFT_582635 [Corynespora cassiicola Philippines]